MLAVRLTIQAAAVWQPMHLHWRHGVGIAGSVVGMVVVNVAAVVIVWLAVSKMHGKAC